ncbi:unnamed protein product [Linum tenue]|uniref:Uncharacterized protein n=2 Tax=Linum tenue TaxID=586396 RepID=A0AAV0LSN4_9ROSI|nr:unnamed protein product [Linum tenue]
MMISELGCWDIMRVFILNFGRRYFSEPYSIVHLNGPVAMGSIGLIFMMTRGIIMTLKLLNGLLNPLECACMIYIVCDMIYVLLGKSRIYGIFSN